MARERTVRQQVEQGETPEITRTTRDHDELREQLRGWLSTKVEDAEITELGVPDNGMSSETVLFGASWTQGGETVGAELVARLAAAEDAVPVFPTYDLELQWKTIELVGRHTEAPVPRLRWLETDPSVIGSPFFVMDRAHGEVPPDVMPYPIESSLLERSAEEQRQLQDASVDVLAEIHRTPVGEHTAFLEYDQPGDTVLRRHVNHWKQYATFARQGRSIPLLDEAEAWLEANWPEAADARDPALSWGDARIGNMMFDGVEPVAVFDWEMAALAPVEVDLGWMSFLHTFFQDITVDLGLPGMPDFMDAEDVAERYRQASGLDIEDLHWFRTYCAYRHGAIMVRVIDRQVHFGDTEPADDPQEAILHRNRLREMIS
ncbi:MAG: phosphotransferase family protein [Actinomycetia bacterium]|nr:phosphotransferase family protein [Actinomycetes bacterium]